jgi:DNA-binding NtrC family response regulator
MKVLVVEYYKPLREVIVMNLIDENPNLEVLQADNFKSAWEQIDGELPDFVASCIYILNDDLNGLDLLQLIQEYHSSIKVVLFSNLIGENYDADELMKRGAYAAIPKSAGIADDLNSAFNSLQ